MSALTVERVSKALTGWYWEQRNDAKAKAPDRFEKAIRFTQGDYDTMVATIQAAATMARHAEMVASDACKRIEQLEGCGVRYMGVWQRAQSYTRGAVVTHAGSAWIAVADKADSEPGAGAEWQLMVKAGRDAR